MEKARELVEEFKSRNKKQIVSEAVKVNNKDEKATAEKIFDGLYDVFNKHKKAAISEGFTYYKEQLAQAKITAKSKKLNYVTILRNLEEGFSTIVASDSYDDAETLMLADLSKRIQF